MWEEVEPRKYSYDITPWALVQAIMIAFAARLSGLRDITEFCAHLLHTSNFSSLSHALSRASFLAFVRLLVEIVECTYRPGKNDIVAIDGMAVTLPKTQRHNCEKFNDKTVGGGVVWSYMVTAARGVCPVKVLKVVQGAWHDTVIMRGIKLIARGPLYLMDRGFYCYELMEQWVADKVRFIVRIKERSFSHEALRTVGKPRRHGALRILLDVEARLGKADGKHRPLVRLVIALLADGEKLILATNQYGWSAETILDTYDLRWHIERFHRFLKDTLGLAHLYSFSQTGIEFLIYTALLSALLLFFADKNPSGETIHILRRMLRLVRRALGLGTPWKRNTFSPRRAKGKSAKDNAKNH